MTSELNLEDAAFITRPLSQGLGAVGVGVCELDGEGRVEWLSHHAAKLFGTTVEAAVGQSLTELMAHAERSALPLRLVHPGPRLAFVVEDLDRGGVLAQLKLNHAAVEAAANSIVIADSDGLIQYVNPAFCLMTGYSKAEAVGRHTRLLKSGHQDREFYEVLWATLLSGATWHGTLINRRKDGSTYTEESTITPIMSSGHPTHFIAVKRDVTEQRRLEAAALRSERLGVVGELAVSVAHDLANVLAPVVSTVSFLKDEDTTALERAEAITDLEDGARRATAMVRQLVDFARGGIGLRAAIQTTRLTRTYAEQLRRAMPKRVTFEVLVKDDLPVLVADSLQLYQVLLNLCVNAADAMPTGGVLVLAASVLERDGATFVEFTVSDTGTGIEPRVLPHVFEPFYTTKEPGQGTGLGLPTVKRVAEAHGGSVTVKSTLGQGSTFSVCFPAGP
ncbi:MAG: PAS domain S-box protein [Myxococcales bacterium]|nr:PAS domain S-box protein [Myxococcales bacterium]